MKKILKQQIILIIIILSTTLFSCSKTVTKDVTVSTNTADDILVEENESNELINNGSKLLSDKKYEEAMAYYNKALELDKSNKDLYLKIKDLYIEANRLDDAYFIIKSAINNNVDTENMKKISEDISSKLEILEVNDKVNQDSEYYFPQNINTTINEKPISLPIKWDYSKADTSTHGTFEYYGFNEEYGRKVKVTLTVLEVSYDKQIGSIKDIYTVDGKTYIDVDLVEFYLGEEALKEALKDNAKIAYTENGIPFVPSGYYIRNNYSNITTYEISNDCSFQLLDYDFISLGYNSSAINSFITQTASFNDFKNYIELTNYMYVGSISTDGNKPIPQRETLCWIELKNNVAYSIYRQYTP